MAKGTTLLQRASENRASTSIKDLRLEMEEVKREVEEEEEEEKSASVSPRMKSYSAAAASNQTPLRGNSNKAGTGLRPRLSSNP